jgi:tetratricopeptide (TPR) repeat protein
VAYFAAGDYDHCRSEMRGISKDPKTGAGAAYFLGRVARIEENLDEAAAYFDQTIHLLPSFAEAYTELAHVRLRQDRLKDAKAAIDRALSLDPESFQANSALLAMYQKTHDARAEEQSVRLRKLDETRSKRQELMFRSIEVKPY